MKDRIENTILSNLFYKEEYARKVLPFLKSEYFVNRIEQVMFNSIYDFITKYNNVPTKDAILIEVNNRKDINDTEHNNIKDYKGNPAYKIWQKYISKVASASETIAVYLSFSALYNNVLE